MKKVVLISLVFVFVGSLFLSTSCKKEELPYLTCKIDGEQYTSLFRLSNKGGVSDFDKEVFLFVATDAASRSDGKFLTMITAGVEAKEYVLNVNIWDAALGSSIVYNPGGEAGDVSTKYTGLSGSIIITEVNEADSKVSGTFSFVLTNTAGDQIEITEGEFGNLKFQNTSVSTDIFKP